MCICERILLFERNYMTNESYGNLIRSVFVDLSVVVNITWLVVTFKLSELRLFAFCMYYIDQSVQLFFFVSSLRSFLTLPNCAGSLSN